MNALSDATGGVQGNRKGNRKQTGRVNEGERGGGWKRLITVFPHFKQGTSF